MKKKAIVSIIAMVIAASSVSLLAGCGENDKDPNSTTVPATTSAPATAKATQPSTSKSVQPSTSQSNGQSGNDNDDMQATALNAYGVSASNGYYAVQTGATHNVEGTFNIYGIYDGNGNFCDYVYIHTSGYPVYAGQDVFESIHSGNQVDSQASADSQDDGNDQNNAVSQNNGDSPDDIYYGGGKNQGGDGHDYADRGY